MLIVGHAGERSQGRHSATLSLALGTKCVVDDVSDNGAVSETPVRTLVRQRLLERADELVEALTDGYVHGYSSKIPASHRDELIRRRRAGESVKAIATEYNCHPNTVSRAIQARLKELGEYNPVEFHAAQRERKREAREWMKAVWAERDQRIHEAARAAEEQQARLEAADKEARREHRRLLQQRLNERNRRYTGA